MARVATNAKEVPILTANKPVTEAQKPCIKYARPLYYISLLTALTCPIDFDRYTAKSGKWHKVYCVLMVIIIVIPTFLSLHGRRITAFVELQQTVQITDVISLVTVLISNVYAIINILLYGERYIKTYFELLEQIDRNLLTTMNLKRKRLLFYTHLIVTHLILAMLCAYDYWTWTMALGFEIWKYYAIRLYSTYLNFLVVIQICTFASALKVRFEILNERLFFVSMEWVGNLESSKAIVLRDLFFSYKKNSGTPELDGLNLKCLIRMHDLLCDLIKLVNEAFGVNVVLLVCNIIINSVIAFNLMFIYGIGAQTSRTNNWEDIMALNTFWALVFVTMGVVLARTCGSASQEAWKTATISYKLLACVPTYSRFAKERDFRLELKQMAMQVEHRRPAFDASGFFPINQSMLYVIAGAVSSYLVIIIQFNNSPEFTIFADQNNTIT